MTRKEIRKKGFTLMELLAVVAIIGILSALIAVGVIAYNRSLKVMELNNTAEEIYIAAQNHLTALRTNATANDALKNAGYGTKASDISGKPADMTSGSGSQWEAIYAFGTPSASAGISNGTNASGGTNTSGTTTAGNNASAGLSGNTGSATTSGTTASSGSANTAGYAQVAAYILPAGAVDGTVAGGSGSYIIEYNPKAYTVYGVFYADGKSSVLGRDTGKTISVTADLRDLNKEVKEDGSTKITSYEPKNGSGDKGICVGYYGGSNAANLNSSTLEGSISVKLVNAEKLYAEITTTNLSVSGADATAREKKNIRLWLTVTGETSGAVKTYGCTVNASGVADDSKTDKNAWKQQGDAVKSTSTSGTSVTYQVVLDDITTTGSHFAEIFANSDDSSVNFIPGEDITVYASAAVTDSLSNIVYSNTQRTNSLFASLQSSSNGTGTVSGVSGSASSGTGTASGVSGSTSGGSAASGGSSAAGGVTTETVDIENFRHLENLSTEISQVLMWKNGSSTENPTAVSLTKKNTSAANSQSNEYTSGHYALHAVLQKQVRSKNGSISWTDFCKAIAKLDGNSTSAENVCVTMANSTTKTAAGSYAGISNVWLSAFDGNSKTIRDVVIRHSTADGGTANSISDGLFSRIGQKTDLSVKDLALVNFSVTAPASTGSSTADGQAVTITAGSLAGSLTADGHSVAISNVVAYEDNDDYCGIWTDSSATSSVHTGGLIGEISTKNNGSVSLDRCGAAVYVYSASKVSDANTSGSNTSNAENANDSNAGNANDSNAGNANTNTVNKWNIAGGLIGYVDESDATSSTISIMNSYVGGHTANASAPYYSKEIKTPGSKTTGKTTSTTGSKTDGNTTSTTGSKTDGKTSSKTSSKTDSKTDSTTDTKDDSNGSGWNVYAGNASGGFIGAANLSDKQKLSIKNVYSTASACSDGTNGITGGFVGYVTGVEVSSSGTTGVAAGSSDTTSVSTINLDITDSYCTGLVSGKLAGTFAGQIEKGDNVKLADVFNSCKYLNDVNDSDVPAARLDSNTSVKDVITGTDTSGLAASGSKVKAVPYDTALSTEKEYPYISNVSVHYGDWPVIPKTTINHNGNRLMIDVDTASDIVIIRVTGLQSGAYEYIVLYNTSSNLTSNYSDNHSGVFVAKDLRNIIQYNDDGSVKSFEGTGINDVGYQNRLTVKPEGEINHYSLMLDNISGNQDNFLAFCDKTKAGFYYGEYLDIRITDQYTKDNDPRKKTNCMAGGEYVVNSLFEDIFDPAVASKGAINTDGTFNLESNSVKESIQTLTFDGGKELPEDIGDTQKFHPKRTGSNKYVAVIKNARHLENLDSELSGINTQDEKFNVEQAVQGSDIVWKKTWSGDDSATPYKNEYPAYVDELDDKNGASGSAIYETNQFQTKGYFKSIIINEGNELQKYNGNGFKIIGLKLTNGCNDGGNVGLFSKINTYISKEENTEALDFSIYDLELTDVTSSEKGNFDTVKCFGAFVGLSQRNITLERVHLTTDRYGVGAEFTGENIAGGLIGKVEKGTATIKDSDISFGSNNLTIQVGNQWGSGGQAGGLVGIVDNGVDLERCSISASNLNVKRGQNTGGLIGSAGKATVDSCQVTVTNQENISGNEETGGLIGKVNNDADLKNCRISASDLNVTGDKRAGGLVGSAGTGASSSATVIVDNCNLTTESVYVSGFYFTGGLAGIVNGKDVEITNSSFGGNLAVVHLTATSSSSSYAGGLVGEISTPSSFKLDNCYASTYVYAPWASAAGGLIGHLKTYTNDNTYSPITNCYASGRMKEGKYTTETTLTSDDLTSLKSDPIVNVIGGGAAGGLVGMMDQGNISIADSFSTASVCAMSLHNNSAYYAGGLVGHATGGQNKLKITDSYATGLVTTSNDDQQHNIKGTFIGGIDNTNNIGLSDDYVIGSINPDVSAIGNHSNLSGGIEDITNNNVINLQRPDDPNGSRLQTKSYDSSLLDANGNMMPYPYRISTTITAGDNRILYYDGDWPVLTEAEVEGITLSQDSLYLVYNDENLGSAEISATISPEEASGKDIAWSSSYESVAKVSVVADSGDDSGMAGNTSKSAVVEAIKPGQTTITASVDGKSAICTVYVLGIQNSDGTDVTGQKVSISGNDSLQLSIAGVPKGATVDWSIGNGVKWLGLNSDSGNSNNVTVQIDSSNVSGNVDPAAVQAEIKVNGITVATVSVTVALDEQDNEEQDNDEQNVNSIISDS